MILPNINKVIINAGHWDKDPGASANGFIERDEVNKIRDELAPLLTELEVLLVPDNLDLSKSIAWANEKAPRLNDAFALDIHLNSVKDKNVNGCLAVYGTSGKSKEIGEVISRNVAFSLGIKDRGAIPDTQTFAGSLGWIRQTKMWASLVEVCFISNENDMKLLTAPGGYKRVAEGLRNGIYEVLGINLPTPPSNLPNKEQTKQEIIRLLNTL